MWGTEVASWASTRILWVLGLVFTPAFSKFRLLVSGTRPEGNKEQGWKVFFSGFDRDPLVYLKHFSECPLRIGKTSNINIVKGLLASTGLRHKHMYLWYSHTRTHPYICTKNQWKNEAGLTEIVSYRKGRNRGGDRDGNRTSLNTPRNTIFFS